MSRVFQSAGALFALGTVLVIIDERELGEESTLVKEEAVPAQPIHLMGQ